MNKTIALVDCNNFYANCERLFRPDLRGKPIVVLSNNDGCIIARSNEAKALGVPMGLPFFKLKQQQWGAEVIALSSNYALYGDLSHRVMDVLSNFSPVTEVYSIDECFLDLTGFETRDLKQYGRHMKETVYRHTGIPVSIGIASTKTLAKLANRLAKKSVKASGVLNLKDSAYIGYALQKTPIGDVWGIGRGHERTLLEHGLVTAYDLIQQEERWLRNMMGVIGLRTVQELKGIPVIAFDSPDISKKSTVVTRSFGEMMTDYQDLHDIILTFSARAAEKIRRSDLVAGEISVFLRTNRYQKEDAQYNCTANRSLTPFSNDTRDVQSAALSLLEGLYRKGYNYKRAGVMLFNLIGTDQAPKDLFSPITDRTNDNLMATMDSLNTRYGANAVSLGQLPKDKAWYALRQHCSPKYTTAWSDIKGVS